jgi:YggT family protein
MLIYIHYVFVIYTVMLAVRLIASWFPQAQGKQWLYSLSRFTDPYLNVFRRFVPPIGGVLDLSPLLAFFALQLMEILLFKALSFLF